MLIDTHTHLYLEEFNPDRKEVMERAIQAGVTDFILPNIDKDSLLPMTEMKKQWPNQCHLMFGLHPCSVKENWKEEIQQIEMYSKEYNFVAIGEIGLDFYRDLTFKAEQTEALHYQLSWAESLQKPVALHTRNSIDETVSIVKQHSSLPGGVFHCFSGTLEQAEKILEIPGFYLGIGGVLTFKNSHLREILLHVPLERIVLETDAPYLAPVPFRGKRNEPAWLVYVVRQLAEIYQTDEKNISEVTSQNARKLFVNP